MEMKRHGVDRAADKIRDVKAPAAAAKRRPNNVKELGVLSRGITSPVAEQVALWAGSGAVNDDRPGRQPDDPLRGKIRRRPGYCLKVCLNP